MSTPPAGVLIGDRELEVLHELWRRGPSTVAEVQKRLPDDLAYTTVLTILRNLEAKGFVAHEAAGRAHRYAAVIPAKAVHELALTRLLRNVFRGDALALVASLVQRKALSPAQLRELAEAIDAKRGGASRRRRK
jgi:predicted transcriptional regulator